MDPYDRREQPEPDPYLYQRSRNEHNRGSFGYEGDPSRGNNDETYGCYSRNYGPTDGTHSHSRPVESYSRLYGATERGSQDRYQSFQDSHQQFESDLYRSHESLPYDYGPRSQSAFSQYNPNYGSSARGVSDRTGTVGDIHGDRFSRYSNVHDYQMDYQPTRQGITQSTDRLLGTESLRGLEHYRSGGPTATMSSAKAGRYDQFERDTAHLRAQSYSDRSKIPSHSKASSFTVSNPYAVEDRPGHSEYGVPGKELEEGEISEDDQASVGMKGSYFPEKCPVHGYVPQSQSSLQSSMPSGVPGNKESAGGFPSSHSMLSPTQRSQGMHIKSISELNLQDQNTGSRQTLGSGINERFAKFAGYQATPALMSLNTGKC